MGLQRVGHNLVTEEQIAGADAAPFASSLETPGPSLDTATALPQGSFSGPCPPTLQRQN